ncbi:MAG TPA: hypothetical protein VN709_10290 [Terriglobales bacterium]|nr:hypothetical protein [Terriglobales bacterium]
MNGGRLSDDEAFLLGMADLRARIASDTVGGADDVDAISRALTRVAMRYPDAADEFGQLFAARQLGACRDLLDTVAAQHAIEMSDEMDA